MVSSAGRCALTLLLQALRELGGVLSAVDVPQGVIDTFPSLSDLQTQLFTTVLIPEFAGGAPDEVMRLEPTDLLLEMLAAARTSEWPRLVVLVHDAISNQRRLDHSIAHSGAPGEVDV